MGVSKKIKIGLSVLAIGIVLGVGLLVGCRPKTPPLALFVAVDNSGSNHKNIQKSFAGLDGMIENSQDGTVVKISTFAKSTEILYQGVPREPNDLYDVQDQIIDSPPSSEKGTNPENALEGMVSSLQIQANKCAGVILWDGEVYHPETLKASAQKLADSPKFLGLYCIGVDPKLRPEVERILKPIFGEERLTICGTQDIPYVVDRYTKMSDNLR